MWSNSWTEKRATTEEEKLTNLFAAHKVARTSNTKEQQIRRKEPDAIFYPRGI